MTTTDQLYQMAQHAAQYIRGMPWNAIEEQTGLGPADAVYDIAYRDRIVDAIKEASAIRDKLTLSHDLAATPEGAVAWEEAKEIIASGHGQFMAAVNANAQWLSGAPELHLETYRAMISLAWLDIVVASKVHLEQILQLGGMDADLIVNSADTVYSACKGFVMLYEVGMLNPLLRSSPAQTPQPVSGLGLALTAGGIAWIVLASLVGISVVAYVILSSQNAAATAKAADDICDAAIAEDDPEKHASLLAACVALRNKIIEEQNKDPGESAINTAVTILSIGVIAYAGVLLMPHITKAFAKTKRQRAQA